MSYSEILFDVSDRIATITLHRPDKLNAWTMTMDAEFRHAVAAAEQDPEVRVVVITGSGRGFCAGADMALLQTRPIVDFIQPFTFLQELSKPVIAAINGPAVGLGLILTLYCDLRFASADARFGTAFARRGLIAEYGMAWMLPRLIGPAQALDILLSARIFDAEEAARLNLVNRVYPSPTFLFDVRAYAELLATQVSPRSLTVIKRQVFAAMQQTLAEATTTAEQEMVLSLESEDFKEGVAHFLEKRPPSFTGA
ncbi:MAG: enoyl-CoA hydratase-related protein [Acidobacteria bacterium]|nr:enoyl-CoA hydratase-related protein [Acidobacteriota bacterium]